MSQLSTAANGDVYERDGVRWVVVGFVRDPCVLLRREGLEPLLPINERTDLAVIPGSLWADDWYKVAPQGDRSPKGRDGEAGLVGDESAGPSKKDAPNSAQNIKDLP